MILAKQVLTELIEFSLNTRIRGRPKENKLPTTLKGSHGCMLNQMDPLRGIR